jgi:hypothetical protein
LTRSGDLVVWQGGVWQVVCYPEDGGRIASVRWNGHELMTQPHAPAGGFRAPAAEFGEYESRPVFGYDDCWPTLRPSQWPGVGIQARDHGEICWKEWRVSDEDGALRASTFDAARGWHFERVIDADDDCLTFRFTCTNTGKGILPFHWAGHGLTPPTAAEELRVPRFGSVQLEHPVRLSLDLRTPEDVRHYLVSQRSGTALFMVLKGLTSHAVTVGTGEMEWTLSLTGIDSPAMGIWYNRRGFPTPGDLSRDEFGVEWMTGPDIGLADAVEAGTAIMLRPGESKRWGVTWDVSRAPSGGLLPSARRSQELVGG